MQMALNLAQQTHTAWARSGQIQTHGRQCPADAIPYFPDVWSSDLKKAALGSQILPTQDFVNTQVVAILLFCHGALVGELAATARQFGFAIANKNNEAPSGEKFPRLGNGISVVKRPSKCNLAGARIFARR